MLEVSEGGKNELSNLIALCPSCHALFHRGTISRSAIYRWKAMLVSLSQAFDKQTIDDLLLLNKPDIDQLKISGDGVLQFSRLIAAGLAEFKLFSNNGDFMYTYTVQLTEKGKMFVEDWINGDRSKLAQAPTGYRQEDEENNTIFKLSVE